MVANEGDKPFAGFTRLLRYETKNDAYYKNDAYWMATYHNAISVLNYCDGSVESLLLQDLQVGDKVLMDLTPTQDRCLILFFAFEDAPKFGYNAKNISLCSQ